MAFVLYALTTEKAVGSIDKENKLTFIVDQKATKADVKKEVEQKFNVKVAAVNVIRTLAGKKKASVKLTKAFKADDVAARLKIA